MLREALALALAVAVCSGASVGAEPRLSSAERLARLADERGPIRRHLEAVRAYPLVDRDAPRVGADSVDASRQVRTTPPVHHAKYWQSLALLAIMLAVGIFVTYVVWDE